MPPGQHTLLMAMVAGAYRFLWRGDHIAIFIDAFEAAGLARIDDGGSWYR
jgi:hypothetical protein